jgi:two-component system OmpR family sensor kinase
MAGAAGCAALAGYSCRVLIESRSRARTGQAQTQGPGGRKAILPGVRTRVLVSFLVLLVISTAASVLVLRQVLMSRIGDQVETELTDEIDDLRQLAGDDTSPDGRSFLTVEGLFKRFLAQNPPLPDSALVTFVDGNPYKGASNAPSDSGLVQSLAGLSSITEPQKGDVDTGSDEARYVAVPVTAGDQEGVLVAAGLRGAERDQVESAVRIAIGVSLVVLLMASLFIWLAAGRALSPLWGLSRTARGISETDLSQRIPVRGRDELAELGRTFNGMLDRLETAFANQKDFLTDVSHELRTPITVIRGHLETLGDSPAERREAIAVIQDELDRMNRFVDDLLLLARAPRPDFLRMRPIDLDLFTNDLFAKARSLGEREWRLDGTGVGILVADQQRLTQAVMNLATNAVRHTREGETIWIGSSLVAGNARLWVRDDGPGIEPAAQERIFERFTRVPRAGASGGDGAGLGLAIVRAIAEAHDGKIELDSRPGVGATFTIVVPAEPGPAEE